MLPHPNVVSGPYPHSQQTRIHRHRTHLLHPHHHQHHHHHHHLQHHLQTMVLHRGKEALLLWCKAYTNGYHHVQVSNFTTSWHDGLAFCALLHCFRPDLIEYEPLTPEDVKHNLTLAFEIATKVSGVVRWLWGAQFFFFFF